jgi:hypothetical protein
VKQISHSMDCAIDELLTEPRRSQTSAMYLQARLTPEIIKHIKLTPPAIRAIYETRIRMAKSTTVVEF